MSASQVLKLTKHGMPLSEENLITFRSLRMKLEGCGVQSLTGIETGLGAGGLAREFLLMLPAGLQI